MRSIVIEPGRAPRVESLDGDAEIAREVGSDVAFMPVGERAVLFVQSLEIPESGELRLRINHVATLIARKAREIGPQDLILGVVVVAGVDGEGNQEDIDESYVRSAKQLHVAMSMKPEEN